jgi:hypothetical protein
MESPCQWSQAEFKVLGKVALGSKLLATAVLPFSTA